MDTKKKNVVKKEPQEKKPTQAELITESYKQGNKNAADIEADTGIKLNNIRWHMSKLGLKSIRAKEEE